jgi:exopolysaccharide biosynthesis polyprenyl glycosylphosphotransferase
MRTTGTSAAASRPVPVSSASPVRRREQLAARLGLRPDAVWALARFALDLTMLCAAAVASALGSGAARVEVAPIGWVGLFVVLVLAAFTARGMYRARLRTELLDDLRGVVAATSLAAMAVLTLRALMTDAPDLAAQVIRPWAFATVYLAAGRVALHWSQSQARRHGEALRPTLIVGAGRVGRLTARRLLEQPELGLKPIGFIDKEPMEIAENGAFLPVLGASWDLDRIVEEHGVEHVVVAFSTAPDDVLLRLFRRCEQLGVTVSFVPRLFEAVTTRLDVDHLGGLPLITARTPNPYGWRFMLKHVFDRLLALGLILLLSPILIASALAIWSSMGRPILFRQRRVGRDGREFEMLKLRTMHGDPTDGEADADWARAELHEDDPSVAPLGSSADDRSTRVGNILRRFSIDEIPQLFNVVAGHMSIVGPRPERSHYVSLFEQRVYRYGDRHRVKSGITGWAQVNGLRGQTSLADRIEWDNYYIENWSLWLDFKILLLTAVAVVRSSKSVG